MLNVHNIFEHWPRILYPLLPLSVKGGVDCSKKRSKILSLTLATVIYRCLVWWFSELYSQYTHNESHENRPSSWLGKPEQGSRLFLDINFLLTEEWQRRKTLKERIWLKNNRTSSMNNSDSISLVQGPSTVASTIATYLSQLTHWLHQLPTVGIGQGNHH